MSSSDSGSDDRSDDGSFVSNIGGGDLNEWSEDEWNELCGECNAVAHSTLQLSEKRIRQNMKWRKGRRCRRSRR